MIATKVVSDRIKVPSLLAGRLGENHVPVPAVLRRARLPAPLRLELTRAVQNRKLVESHFGCRVRFESTRNALAFRNSDLDRPFVTQNKELLKAIGAQLEAELQEQNSPDVGEQVKHSLKRFRAGKRPTLRRLRGNCA
jgi:hypothetical protein